MRPSDEIDYTKINPANKWKILRNQWRYGLWCLWTSIGSMMLGFDYVNCGQLAALSEFQKFFVIQLSDGSWIIPAIYLSAWGSIGLGCDVIAAWLCAPLIEKFGRKPFILISAILSTAGVVLQQLAPDWRVHLAGRAVNGTAIAIIFTICPLWIGETCRPELRGFSLCVMNTSIVVGQVLDVVVARACSTLDTEWQWWIPVICMYTFPLFLVVVWPFFPESPYWLVREQRYDDVKRSLRRMYGFDDEVFYDIEVKWLQEDVLLCNEIAGDAQPRRKTILGFIPLPTAELACFDKKNLKRTLTAMCAASSQQLIGRQEATLRLRAGMQALVTMSQGLWGLIMMFTVPYMINPDAGHLGGKVGFIFCGLGLIAAVLGWILYPETKGLRFEKLDELYALGVKPRHFKKRARENPTDNVVGAKQEQEVDIFKEIDFQLDDGISVIHLGVEPMILTRGHKRPKRASGFGLDLIDWN